MIFSLTCVLTLSISVLFVNCAKKKQPEKKLKKTESKPKANVVSKTPPASASAKKDDDDDDVQFNIKAKPIEVKKDEFDDDEENPLAKIPTKPRLPKNSKSPAGGSSAVCSGANVGGEQNLYPTNDNVGNSAYVSIANPNH